MHLKVNLILLWALIISCLIHLILIIWQWQKPLSNVSNAQSTLSGRLMLSPKRVTSSNAVNSDGVLVSGTAAIERQKASNNEAKEIASIESIATNEATRSKRALWRKSGESMQFMQNSQAFIEAQNLHQREVISRQQQHLRVAVEESFLQKVQALSINDFCEIKLSVSLDPEVFCLKEESTLILVNELRGTRIPPASGFSSERVWNLKEGRAVQEEK